MIYELDYWTSREKKKVLILELVPPEGLSGSWQPSLVDNSADRWFRGWLTARRPTAP